MCAEENLNLNALRSRAYRRANPEKARASVNKYRNNNPEYFRQRQLSRFCPGFTEAHYEIMLQEQNGVCEICGVNNPQQKRIKRFHIDHDHACCPNYRTCCGKCIRGLLCDPCNRALGMFKDSPDLLRKAANYLDKYKS